MFPTNPPPESSHSMGASPIVDGEMSPLGNLVSICWRRKTTLLLTLLLGSLCGILSWQRQDEVYQSSTQLLLILGEGATSSTSATVLRDRLDAQIGQLRDPLIMERIVRLSLARSHDAATLPANVSDHFHIEGKDNLLRMSFFAPTAETSRLRLLAILEGYQNYLKYTPQSNRRETCERLTVNIQQLEKQLSENQQRSTNLLRSTPFAGTTRSIADQLDERLQRLENKRQDLRIRKAELERQLRGQPLRALTLPVQALTLPVRGGASPLEKAAAQAVLSLELRERLIASRARGDRPEVRRASQDAQQARQVYAQTGKRAALEVEFSEIRELTGAIEQLLRSEKAQVQKWSGLAAEAHRLQNAIHLQEESLRSSKQELQQRTMALESESCRLQVIVPAKPGVPRSLRDTLSQNLLLGILSGLSLGLLLTYWAEFCDQGFQTPGELQKRLGLPLLGQLPFASTPENPETGSFVADYQFSQSERTEQFRKIRADLLLSPKRPMGKTLLITSPRRGDGRTLAAANLAAAFAQTGRKTLLVDADLKQPELHQTFEVPLVGGLAGVLGEKITWQTAVLPTRLPNLDLLPAGQASGATTELLSSQHLPAFLQSAQQHYDILIIDAPPLLDCLDPLVIANHVDSILPVLRVSQRSRSEAQQVFERLASLSQRVVGIVMNNVNNRRPVWRTDPFESYRWIHQPHATPLPPEARFAADTPAPKRHPAQTAQPSAQKPLVEYNASELGNLLSELSAEVRQVVANSSRTAHSEKTRT